MPGLKGLQDKFSKAEQDRLGAPEQTETSLKIADLRSN
jgi:hypothetical protein